MLQRVVQGCLSGTLMNRDFAPFPRRVTAICNHTFLSGMALLHPLASAFKPVPTVRQACLPLPLLLHCSQLIMSREAATLSGSYHPYAKRRTDWRAVFEELSCDSPHRTVKKVAIEHSLPSETLRARWKKYQLGVEKEDATLVAIACGDVDGRRDNHRILLP